MQIDTNTLPIKVTYVGATHKDEWACDQWAIEFSNKAGYWTTDYFTGLGLRKHDKPIKPTNDDILHSLILDASAADSNFADWCAEFGCSDDSIKALNTYQACLKTATNLRKYLGRDVVAQLAEQLADH